MSMIYTQNEIENLSNPLSVKKFSPQTFPFDNSRPAWLYGVNFPTYLRSYITNISGE